MNASKRIKVKPPGPNAKSWISRWKSCGSKLSFFETAFSSAKGIYVEDVDGNRYLDFTAMTCNVGHANAKVLDAVVRQLKLTGVEAFRLGVHESRVLLAEKIKQIAPKALATGKVDFCNTGSDAGDLTMKLARAYTRRQILLSYIGSHHGRTFAALSLTADFSYARRYCLPLVPSIVHVPYPYCYRCPLGQAYPDCSLRCLDFIRYVLDTVAHPEEVAAIFVEPIQQMGGIVIPPKEYFSELRKMCDDYDILLVDDEVVTGFGRTGKTFAIEHWGVTPDIMYMGKPIANGMSLSAIIAKKEIMDAEEKLRMITPGSFAGNVIACASALATIKVIEEEKLTENAQMMGKYIVGKLSEMAERQKLIGDVRGMGLLVGVELVRDNRKPARIEAEEVVSQAFKRGLILGTVGIYKNVLRLTPPLVITKEQADEALNILEEALKKAEIGKTKG